MTFDLSEEQSSGDQKGGKIKSPDEIRATLEENILNLQSIASSKFAAAFSKRVRKWESDLNTVSEVITIWLQV